MTIVSAFLRVYLIVLLARAILSWFPITSSGGALAQVQRILFDVTEPVLAPVRRVIPPAGMFDISFMVVFIVILLVREQSALQLEAAPVLAAGGHRIV